MVAPPKPGDRLAALTGWADGPPLDPDPAVVSALDAAVGELERWSAAVGKAVRVEWEPLLVERAALLGLLRRGRVSANGSCRLLPGRGGWMALNLARPDDLASVEALVGAPSGDDPWAAVADALDRWPVAEVVERARLLGLPAAVLGAPGCAPRPAVVSERWWAPATAPRPLGALSVVDLSSMWAGPLAALLLARAGAEVRKVESTGRPDGTRSHPGLFRRLHPPGQPEERLDLTRAEGRRRLRQLLDRADVVLESSRPRALDQLGAGPAAVAPRPGRVWVSITGYGRTDPAGQWVAFGDDAAVAGGLVGRDADGGPVFCGDAVADPVTGLVAAAAALRSLALGGGHLLDVSMCHAAASMVAGSMVAGSVTRVPAHAPR